MEKKVLEYLQKVKWYNNMHVILIQEDKKIQKLKEKAKNWYHCFIIDHVIIENVKDPLWRWCDINCINDENECYYYFRVINFNFWREKPKTNYFNSIKKILWIL